MSFLVSPGVHVKEIDLTNVVPSVDTTIGALAGPFEKGPVSKVTTITSETDLVKNFDDTNHAFPRKSQTAFGGKRHQNCQRQQHPQQDCRSEKIGMRAAHWQSLVS